MEIEVLRRLSAQGAPVPKVLGVTDQLFFQQDIGSRRLTGQLASQTRSQQASTARTAFESLFLIREAAAKSGLADVVPALGDSPDWVRGLVISSLQTADLYSTTRAEIDIEAIVDRLSVPATRFVKWDARPGNGAVADDGRVFWFDWEHCGRRQGMEDFAWLAGDEFWPFGPDKVVAMLTDLLPADQVGVELAYLSDFITFHIVQRLQMIHIRFMAAGWVDPVDAMRYDRIGVDPDLAKALCGRGADWADHSPLMRPMAAWFVECAAAIDGLKRPEKSDV